MRHGCLRDGEHLAVSSSQRILGRAFRQRFDVTELYGRVQFGLAHMQGCLEQFYLETRVGAVSHQRECILASYQTEFNVNPVQQVAVLREYIRVYSPE